VAQSSGHPADGDLYQEGPDGGISAKDVRMMVADNPAKILGI